MVWIVRRKPRGRAIEYLWESQTRSGALWGDNQRGAWRFTDPSEAFRQAWRSNIHSWHDGNAIVVRLVPPCALCKKKVNHECRGKRRIMNRRKSAKKTPQRGQV